MTTTDQRPGNEAADEPADPRGRHASEPSSAEDRGTLEVHPSVVRKIAERAADLTPGTLPSPRRVAGIGAGRHGARARVDGEGGTVDVDLDLALRYPSPVRELTEQVCRQVTDEVHRITGYRVRSVRVTVSALLPETRNRVE